MRIRGLFFALLSLSLVGNLAARPVEAKGDGNLHIVKTCGPWLDAKGAAGSSCTIAISNVREIPVGTTIFYDQAAGAPINSGAPAGFLDSNVLLYVGPGNWAVGRCTVEFATFTGLCTFSNGVGGLEGFQARINVTPAGGADFNWDGKYNFGGK